MIFYHSHLFYYLSFIRLLIFYLIRFPSTTNKNLLFTILINSVLKVEVNLKLFTIYSLFFGLIFIYFLYLT